MDEMWGKNGRKAVLQTERMYVSIFTLKQKENT